MTEEALRQATREANEVLKDLRAEHKEWKDTHRAFQATHKAIQATIAGWHQAQANTRLLVQDEVLKAVQAELPKVAPAVKAAIAKSEAAITEKFEKLGNELVNSIPGNLPSLMELAKALKSMDGSAPTTMVVDLRSLP